MLSFVRAAPLRRQPATLTDRFLGVSRLRRQAAYAAFAAGYVLLKPALRRGAGSTLVALVLVGAVGLVAHF